jgi:hypothetical protein
MMSSDSQAPSYAYISSSAQSTRQLLESTSTSDAALNYTSTSPTSSDAPTRLSPGRRSSTTNYANADARARAAIVTAESSTAGPAPQTSDGSKGEKSDGHADTDAGATTARERAANIANIGWRPRLARTHSWNRQDLKHELQMSLLLDERAGAGLGLGFSEVLGKAVGDGQQE